MQRPRGANPLPPHGRLVPRLVACRSGAAKHRLRTLRLAFKGRRLGGIKVGLCVGRSIYILSGNLISRGICSRGLRARILLGPLAAQREHQAPQGGNGFDDANGPISR